MPEVTCHSTNTVSQNWEFTVPGVQRSFTYDASGNTLTDGQRTFTWDAKNRLRTVTKSGTTYEWDYDYRDRRVREYQYAAGGSKPSIPTWQYLWRDTELVQERTGTSATAGTVKRSHVFGGFEDRSVSGGTTIKKNYLVTRDHLGHTREVIVGNTAAGTVGTLLARYDYSPYQGPSKVYGTTVDASLLTIGRYYHHAATGLELALYRAYDSELGRWMSEDPLGEEGGINLYGYVGNGPVMRVDPLGLDPVPGSEDLGNFTGNFGPKGSDCASYAFDGLQPTKNCRAVKEGEKCNDNERKVIVYASQRNTPHVIREDADGTYSHQAGQNDGRPNSGAIFDKVKNPRAAAKCYFGRGGDKIKQEQHLCCPKK